MNPSALRPRPVVALRGARPRYFRWLRWKAAADAYAAWEALSPTEQERTREPMHPSALLAWMRAGLQP